MSLSISLKSLTLRNRFLLYNLLLVIGLILIGGLSIWRLNLLQGDVDVSRNVYAEMRTLGTVGNEITIARRFLLSAPVSQEEAARHLSFAVGGLEQFIQVGKGYSGDKNTVMQDAYVPINKAADLARAKLQLALEKMRSNPPAADPIGLALQLDEASGDLDTVSTTCLAFLSLRQQTASTGVTRTHLLIGLLSLAAILAAVSTSFLQIRLVVSPLAKLRQGVRRVAEAQFTSRLVVADMGPTPEFQEIAAEFNHMAGELDELYQKLEERVRAKSRELVQSERLASVGFLAAGVAHEINNPLNIISGYAELTSRQLDPSRMPLDEEGAEQARQGLRIIHDEAFRCKEITEKLLSLARTGSKSREALDLSGVVRDVANMTRGLKNYANRTLTLKLDPADSLEVDANLTEMKQVLLNLTINALEAVPASSGEVCIEGRRSRGWVELLVKDNGRGMSPDVLNHVFEPFFTSRKGAGSGEAGTRGTGLGLSITHAIVEDHGGGISAQSEGVGRGACFTVRLPARSSGESLALRGGSA